MATHERAARFQRDWQALTQAQRKRFRLAFQRFDADLDAGRVRPGLRVKRIEGTEQIFELTWARDGRATFEYGETRPSGRHIIWRRIGTHEVFRRP